MNNVEIGKAIDAWFKSDPEKRACVVFLMEKDGQDSSLVAGKALELMYCFTKMIERNDMARGLMRMALMYVDNQNKQKDEDSNEQQ